METGRACLAPAPRQLQALVNSAPTNHHAKDTAMPTFKIHSTIGIARLGNADPDKHFIGPEVPGRPLELDLRQFRDHGLLLRQGARFRVFAYDDHPGAPQC
jgi:hypothetical protein